MCSPRSFPGGDIPCAEATFWASWAAIAFSFFTIAAAPSPGVVSALTAFAPSVDDWLEIVETLFM